MSDTTGPGPVFAARPYINNNLIECGHSGCTNIPAWHVMWERYDSNQRPKMTYICKPHMDEVLSRYAYYDKHPFVWPACVPPGVWQVDGHGCVRH